MNLWLKCIQDKKSKSAASSQCFAIWQNHFKYCKIYSNFVQIWAKMYKSVQKYLTLAKSWLHAADLLIWSILFFKESYKKLYQHTEIAWVNASLKKVNSNEVVQTFHSCGFVCLEGANWGRDANHYCLFLRPKIFPKLRILTIRVT